MNYNHFLQNKINESKEQYENTIRAFHKEAFDISEDILNLSSDYVDSGFRLEYAISYSSNPEDLYREYMFLRNGEITFDNMEHCLRSLHYKNNYYFFFLFRNKLGDMVTNVVSEFAFPFIKRLCNLYSMSIYSTKYKSSRFTPYIYGSSTFLQRGFSNDVYLILKLNK